jgi:D-xylonolactonase
VIREDIDSDMRRFNDVITDPEGRVFAGTIGRTDESGGLYRIDRDGSVQCVWKGTGIANGMGFTTDLSRFYWTCTTSSQIYIADYDRQTGTLHDRRLFYAVPKDEGGPDGLTVDAEDHIWSARWGGSAVYRLSPDAKVVDRIEFPVEKITSVTFGGPALDTLYVTSAGGSSDSQSADGTLFRVQVPARGRPEFWSRIAL